jgi:hypothetical protein
MKKIFGVIFGACVTISGAAYADSVTQQVQISGQATPVCTTTGLAQTWSLGKITETQTGAVLGNFAPTIDLGTVTCTTEAYVSIKRAHQWLALGGNGVCETPVGGVHTCVEYSVTAKWNTGVSAVGATSEYDQLTSEPVLQQAASGPLELSLRLTSLGTAWLLKGGSYSDNITVQVGTPL